MRPLAFPGLADENIHPDVVVALVARGKDVVPAAARGLIGASDEAILAAAHAEGRVVLTHDADFGALAVRRGVPFTGIIHLRPGHILAAFVVGILDAIEVRQQDGVRVFEGVFPLRRLAFAIGEGVWADTDTVADAVQVRFRIVQRAAPAAKK